MYLSGSPRVEGDDEEDDIDDLENEFNYTQGNGTARRQWKGEDADLSSSSRHESLQPIPLLTNGHLVSDEDNSYAFKKKGSNSHYSNCVTFFHHIFFPFLFSL